MRTPTPAWFIYFLCGLFLALLVCLFLVPTTAQPSGTEVARQIQFFFPRL